MVSCCNGNTDLYRLADSRADLQSSSIPYCNFPLSVTAFLSYYARKGSGMNGGKEVFNILLAIVCILVLIFWKD